MNFEINSKNIIKFVMPCIMTMVFTSIFVMSDGIIAANFINETALAAINLVFPVTSLFLAIGLMFGSGISAICSKFLGEGNSSKAKESVSLILLVGLIIGIIFTFIIQINIDNLLNFLGTSEETYTYAYSYLKMLSYFYSILIIQTIFQNTMIVAGKAFTYFKTMMFSGVVKILLGILFVKYLDLGITGLAFTCALGYLIPAVVSFVILLKNNEDGLSLVKPKFDKEVIFKACTNGSSEMVTNLASAITTFLFNSAMLTLIGDDGVSAVTIILYTQFLLSSIFMGYSIGIAPVIGFNYGRKNSNNLHKIFINSLKIVSIISALSFLIGLIFSGGLTSLFAEEGSSIYNLASPGLKIFSVSFIFMGINIFASGMFTAYSNGKISAFISALRTIVLIGSALLILPNIFGITGVWIAVPIAEFITIFVSFILFKKYSGIYMYRKNYIIEKPKEEKDNFIITLNRSFGSGGKEISKRLADELKISFYDENIIDDCLNEKGISDSYLEKYSDKNFTKNYDFKFATSFVNYNQSLVSDVFEKKAKIIKELSNINDSIFVGNCANYILEDKVTFNIYVYASNENFIIDRLLEKNSKDKNKSKKELRKIISTINKNRENFYLYYTGTEINDVNNYDLVIDVSKYGIKKSVKIILEAVRK